jgi:hypothetical protein
MGVSNGARPAERALVDDRLRLQIVRTLEQGLSRFRGRRVRIREVQRRFSRWSSTFRTERLRVSLDGDEKPLRIFFKDLHPAHQVTDVRVPHGLGHTPSRLELDMYRSILSRGRFGTLHLYASRWEPDPGRCWLFLEDAGRTPLHNVHDLPQWVDAARWSARFHAATRHLSAAQTRFLPRWDRTRYGKCAERVQRLLPTVDDHERETLRAGLDALTANLDRLSALPRCVIHGQFFGSNIMLRPRKTPPRIAVIDWETAALGPPAFDLASICGCRWSGDKQLAMRAAYVEQYETDTGEAVDWDAFCRELNAVGIYQALEWLVWWGPHRSVPQFLKRFRTFVRRLEALLDARAHARTVGGSAPPLTAAVPARW